MDAGTKFLGIRLREVREKRGLNQRELAELAGSYVSNMSYYESGKRIPSLELFVKIAGVLGVSTDYLLGNTDDEGILLDEEVRSMVRDYQALTPRDRETVYGLIKMLSRYPES